LTVSAIREAAAQGASAVPALDGNGLEIAKVNIRILLASQLVLAWKR
jgi:hypothetical protein